MSIYCALCAQCSSDRVTEYNVSRSVCARRLYSRVHLEYTHTHTNHPPQKRSTVSDIRASVRCVYQHNEFVCFAFNLCARVHLTPSVPKRAKHESILERVCGAVAQIARESLLSIL